ncbi:hypothetical protein ABT119_05645 [Streptomyces sp. NPDC001910]|uniref:CDI toxin immunity protein n=1 Tax=Streptomyces sp. NPDC001910 TaxID=3154403 RepID=UPI003334447C
MAVIGYGSHPARLSDLLDSFTPEERQDIRLLDAEENLVAEERSLNKFPQTSWGSLVWDDADVIRQRSASDQLDASSLLKEWVAELTSPESEVIIFWGNLVVPSVAMSSRMLAEHVEEVIGISSDLWVYADRERLIIERYHEGLITAARVS